MGLQEARRGPERLPTPKHSPNPFLETLTLCLEEYDLETAVTAQGLTLDTELILHFLHQLLSLPCPKGVHVHLIDDSATNRDCGRNFWIVRLFAHSYRVALKSINCNINKQQ